MAKTVNHVDLIDSHCHAQELMSRSPTPTYNRWASDDEPRNIEDVIAGSKAAGVNRIVCIGTDNVDSALAVEAAEAYSEVWAVVGIHPHEAKSHKGDDARNEFKGLLRGSPRQRKIVGIGECGLDYYYEHSPKEDQQDMLRFQIELALKHDLAINFHVREAFNDFWPIFDSYSGIKGVLHSYTDNLENLEKGLERGLNIGVNGIVTFAKDEERRVIYRTIPLNRLLLETDAPYLTPVPYRGKVCEPKHVRVTAEFLAELRGESLEDIAQATTKNAELLYRI